MCLTIYAALSSLADEKVHELTFQQPFNIYITIYINILIFTYINIFHKLTIVCVTTRQRHPVHFLILPSSCKHCLIVRLVCFFILTNNKYSVYLILI